MRTKSTFLLTPALALAPLACAMAQPPEPSVRLRVNTQLVQISVVVKDTHGNPVTDLKPGDFELYDSGKQQEIRVFHVEDYRPAAGQLPAAPRAPAAKAPEAGTFTNRTSSEEGAPNAPTIVVIDVGNTWNKNRMTWADLVYARDQVIRFLRQIRPEDRLGIYLIGVRQFWILHEYNHDCADLLEKLASWKTPGAPEPASAGAADVWAEFARHFADLDAATAIAIHRSQFYTPNPWEDSNPLGILMAVAHHLAAVPGRKNVVLVSGKVFLPTEFKALVQVLRTIIQDGVAVYAIDPGGLAPYSVDASYVLSGEAKLKMNTDQDAIQDVNRAYHEKHDVGMQLQLSLTELAEATGGRVFFGTNDVLGAIRSSFEDSRVTYTLGFYPKTSANDGSFHPIKVKVPGREHLSVRCRDGYFEPPQQQDSRVRTAELREAAVSPVDATAIALDGSVSSVGPNGYDLKLNIGLSSVSLLPEGDHWNGQIELALFQCDSSGNAIEPLPQTLGLAVRQDSYDKALRNGLPISRHFSLNPGATSLRVIVRDLGSGNMGTLTIPVLPAR